MKDRYEEMKENTRNQIHRELDSEKRAFIKDVKSGFGNIMKEELVNIKPPSKLKLLYRRIMKVIGL